KVFFEDRVASEVALVHLFVSLAEAFVKLHRLRSRRHQSGTGMVLREVPRAVLSQPPVEIVERPIDSTGKVQIQLEQCRLRYRRKCRILLLRWSEGFEIFDTAAIAKVLQQISIAKKLPPIPAGIYRSEEHTSELQSRENLVCRLLLEKKKISEHKIQYRYTKH